MHQVVVEDPWFGSYVKIMNWGTAMPSTYVGPLFQRSLSAEAIRNYGVVVKGPKDVREKNCDHHWLQGRVTGSGGQTSSGLPVLRASGDRYENTVLQFNGKIRKVTTISSVSTSSPGYTTVTLTGTYVEYYNGAETGRWSSFVSVRFKSLKDPRTGNVTLTDPVVTAKSAASPTAVIAACPLTGSGTDTLGGKLKVIDYYLQQTLREATPVGDYLHLRDEAIWQAIENLSLANINWLTDFSDVAEPLGIAQSLGQFFQRDSSALDVVKKMANLHLFWKYVVSCNALTVEECGKLLHYLKRGAQAVRDKVVNDDLIGHGTAQEDVPVEGGSVNIKYTCKAVFGSGWGAFASLSSWRRMGLLPGASDVWDGIPYSFVVDWVIPVQTSLERAEAMADVVTMDLKYLVLGKKLTWNLTRPFNEGGHSFMVQLEKVDYRRKVLLGLPGNMSYGNLTWGDPRKQALTGGALLVQRHR